MNYFHSLIQNFVFSFCDLKMLRNLFSPTFGLGWRAIIICALWVHILSTTLRLYDPVLRLPSQFRARTQNIRRNYVSVSMYQTCIEHQNTRYTGGIYRLVVLLELKSLKPVQKQIIERQTNNYYPEGRSYGLGRHTLGEGLGKNGEWMGESCTRSRSFKV